MLHQRSRFQPLSTHLFEPIRCRFLSLGAEMRRREFFAVIGGAAALPLVAQAQRMMPVIAYLGSMWPGPNDPREIAFRHGLKEVGYEEGRNVAIEYHSIEGQTADQLGALVADLVRRQVAVIYTSSTAAALAAKSVTSMLPIVFTGASDPVRVGLVSSLNKPESNITGVTLFSHLAGTKRLDLLRDVVADAAPAAILVNPNNPSTEVEIESVQSAAKALGMRIVVVHASSRSDIDAAFASILQRNVRALIVAGDPLISSERKRIIAFAAQNAIPAIYSFRDYAVDGGLMSYGSSFVAVSLQAGTYVGRILRGTKPADLPVVLPTKFELVINRKTAHTLGIEIPAKLLALADEVID